MDLPVERPSQSVLGLGLRLVARMYRMHPVPAITAIVGSFFTAVGIVGSTVVIGWVTDEIVLPAFEPGNSVTLTDILWGVAAVLAIAAVRAGGTVMRRYFAGMTAQRVERSLQERLAGRYLNLPMSFHQRSPAGRLIAHADNDALMATEVLHPVPFTIGTFFLVIFAAITMILTDPVMAFVALGIFPAMYVLNRVYTSVIEAPTARVQAGVGRVSSVAHESFDGALVVKTLGRADAELERFTVEATRLRVDRVTVSSLRALFEAILEALPNLGIAIVVLVGAYRIEAGALTGGGLVQIIALFTLLGFPMRVLGFFLEQVPRSVVAHRRLQLVWNEPMEDAGRVSGATLPRTSLSLEVQGLGFTYPATTRLDDSEDADVMPELVLATEPAPTLREISFSVAAGEVVAVVGGTAAGKSTLCSLISGVLEPSVGSVRINGIDVSSIDPAERAGHLALVFQESFLFADSIAQNVSLGEAPESDVRRALSIAAATDFVDRLPDGVHTEVGERGVTLSGGQRQRVALARALVRQPGLIVLDDATSAVDPLVEQEILSALRTRLDTTAVIVAQRLSTIELADRVVFLENGTVAAVGSHSELLDRPAYRSLVEAYAEVAS